MQMKYTAYKLIQFCFLILCILNLPISVFAQVTTLKTNVPTSHILHIELKGKGTIIVDGNTYTKSANVQINRHSKATISVQPSEGYSLKTVLWNGDNITSAVRNKKWTSPAFEQDSVLSVSFERVVTIPMTGDTFQFLQWCLLAVGSAVGIGICLLLRKRKAI